MTTTLQLRNQLASHHHSSPNTITVLSVTLVAQGIVVVYRRMANTGDEERMVFIHPRYGVQANILAQVT